MELVALIVNMVLLVAAFLLGLMIRRGSRRQAMIACSIGLALCLVKPLLARRPDIETQLFPWTDYVLYSGWNGPLAMLVVGAMAGLVRKRRDWAFLVLGGLVTVAYFGDFLLYLGTASGPEVAAAAADQWRPRKTVTLAADAVLAPVAAGLSPASGALPLVAQSTDYSCGAAAAASMLRILHVITDEGEMADLCLTREGRGTLDLGLYRGLNRKLRDAHTGLGVHVRRLTFDDLRDTPKPAILRVRFAADHTVVLLGTFGDRMVVFDPSVPNRLLLWDRTDLMEIAHWSGYAFVPYRLDGVPLPAAGLHLAA